MAPVSLDPHPARLSRQQAAWLIPALALLAVLVIGGMLPLCSPSRAVYLALFIAAVFAGRRLHGRVGRGLAIALAILLCLWTVADAVRLLPTPDLSPTSIPVIDPYLRRPYALEHPNNLAAWSLLLPFGVWTFWTILFTQSRGALLGWIAALAARYVPRRWWLAALPLGVIAMGLAVFIRPATVTARFDFWREGMDLFAARPLTGWGSGSYYESLVSDSPAAQQMNAVTERTGMHTAHNAAVTIAAENGLPGLLSFVALVIGMVRLAARSRHPARYGLLAFAIQQIVDDQWLHPVTSILLGLAFGVCL